jgi:hypothetical protein
VIEVTDPHKLVGRLMAAEAQVEALRKALEEINALSKKELGALLNQCGDIARAALGQTEGHSTPAEESGSQPGERE